MHMNHFAKKGLLRLGVWGVVFISAMLFLGCATAPKPLPQSETQVLIQAQDQDQEQGRISSDPQPSLAQPDFELQSQSQSQSASQPQPMSEPGPQPISEPGPQPISPSQPVTSPSQNQLLKGIPILYYHSIDREVGNELRIPPEEFEAQLKFLYQAGYQSITLDELYQYFYEGRKLPKKPFVLTFDDGYEDNYTNAFPIAKKYGFTGTIFMVTDWIDGKGYLTKEQLREMSNEGWQIGAHTVSHSNLNELTAKQIESELRESKRQLEEILNQPVKYLAYPFGSYTEQIIQESKAAGYIMGFTTERGWAKEKDPYRIQRVYSYANMGVEELKRRVENPNY